MSYLKEFINPTSGGGGGGGGSIEYMVYGICMNNGLSFISWASASEVDDDRSEIKTLQFSHNINGYILCLKKVN